MADSSGVTFAGFGKDFQKKIMQAFLTDHTWSEQMSEVVKVEYFDLKYLRYLVGKYFKYYDVHRCFPTMQLLVTIIKDDLRTGTDTLLRDEIVRYLTEIRANPNPGDLPYVKDKSLDFCRKQAMRSALEKAVEKIANGQDEEVVDLIKNALLVGTSPSLGHDFLEDIEARFHSVVRCPCPTGIKELDAADIMSGGLSKGELGVIVANTGVGKSHFLVQLGCKAMMSGKNVLHYTFELTETVVGLRYDSHLCNVPSNEVIANKEDVLKHYEDEEYGRLIIKEYPTGSSSVVTIRNHMERLSLKGFDPDLIIIDYADIMRSTRKFDSLRHELKLIYEELRNLAMEKKMPIWTASQAHRDSANSDIVGLENMAEAYGKAMVADVVLSISRRPDEKASGTGRLFIAKNRAGRDGLMFPIRIDTARSRISILRDFEVQQLEESQQESSERMKAQLNEKLRRIEEKNRQKSSSKISETN